MSRPLQKACLEGLLEGLQRGNPAAIALPEIVPAVEQLLRADNDALRQLALQIASQLHLNQLPEMQAMFAEARAKVSDDRLPLDERVKSVELLAAAPADLLQTVVMELTAPQQPIDLQLAAVRSAGQSEHAETVRSLLEAYSQFTPQVQVGLLDVVFSRQSYLVVLLDAMEAGTVRRNCLDAARRERLIASRDAEIAACAQRILAEETRRARSTTGAGSVPGGPQARTRCQPRTGRVRAAMLQVPQARRTRLCRGTGSADGQDTRG